MHVDGPSWLVLGGGSHGACIVLRRGRAGLQTVVTLKYIHMIIIFILEGNLIFQQKVLTESTLSLE